MTDTTIRVKLELDTEEARAKLLALADEAKSLPFKADENTSDGYHTLAELYAFRKMYNAALCNEWARQGKFQVHKSKRHATGELCFGGGWFVVIATLPDGDISNHYEMKDWDLFQCEEREFGKEWDGHVSSDVLDRLRSLVLQAEP